MKPDPRLVVASAIAVAMLALALRIGWVLS